MPSASSGTGKFYGDVRNVRAPESAGSFPFDCDELCCCRVFDCSTSNGKSFLPGSLKKGGTRAPEIGRYYTLCKNRNRNSFTSRKTGLVRE